MAFKNPNLNDEGYNVLTGAVHCVKTEAALFDKYHVFVDHHFCVWEHYAVNGTDSTVTQRINRQTSAMYALDQSPFLDATKNVIEPNTRNCVVCGKEVDRAGSRSEVDVTLVKTDGSRAIVGHYRVHDEHRGAEFDVVAQEAEKISAPPVPTDVSLLAKAAKS